MNSKDIANRIVEAILAQKLMPGARLGEQALSMLFDCSRTLVREALMQLAARGIVQVSSRRGWFVVQPSKTEAREAFEARKVIETGLIRSAGAMDKTTLKRLKQHIQQEKTALKQDDVGRRSFLLGDFHVCLAECLGNQLLADTLREMQEDVQSSISYAGGTKLMDIRKVNYVILGGDNAGEHLLM